MLQNENNSEQNDFYGQKHALSGWSGPILQKSLLYNMFEKFTFDAIFPIMVKNQGNDAKAQVDSPC